MARRWWNTRLEWLRVDGGRAGVVGTGRHRAKGHVEVTERGLLGSLDIFPRFVLVEHLLELGKQSMLLTFQIIQPDLVFANFLFDFTQRRFVASLFQFLFPSSAFQLLTHFHF